MTCATEAAEPWEQSLDTMLERAAPAFSPTDTEGWRKEVEAVRRRMDRNAHGHISHALRLQLASDIATFATTIGGAAAMAMSAVLLGSSQPSQTIVVCLATVSGVITLVGIWQAVWQPSGRSREHKLWSAEFSAIEDECSLLLSGLSDGSPVEIVRRASAAGLRANLVPERLWRLSRQRPVKPATSTP